MMSYESFKRKVLREFLNYLPEQYSNCELEIRKVPKVNTCLTGIVVRPKEFTGSYCSPTFYIERMYDQYLECGSFEKVMANQAIYLDEAIKFLPKDIMNIDVASMKDKVVFQVVNTAENREMINLCPHRNFMDLSVVYRVVTNVDSDGVSGFLITNDIARVEELSEALLYHLALKNTKEIFPFKSERIEDTMARMMKRLGADDDDVREAFPDADDIPMEERVYVISNKYEFFGANALLYQEVLDEVANNIGTDCYILPSSVHDLVVLSAESVLDSSRLADLVRETNTEHMRASDRLSDSVYYYSIVDGSLNRIATPDEEVS